MVGGGRMVPTKRGGIFPASLSLRVGGACRSSGDPRRATGAGDIEHIEQRMINTLTAYPLGRAALQGLRRVCYTLYMQMKVVSAVCQPHDPGASTLNTGGMP